MTTKKPITVKPSFLNKRTTYKNGIVDSVSTGAVSLTTQYTTFGGGQNNPVRPDGFRSSGGYNMTDNRYTHHPAAYKDVVPFLGYTVAVEGYPTAVDDRTWNLFSPPYNEIHLSQRNQARTECLNKLGDQKAQIGAYLAEAKEAAEMLASAAADMASALLAVRRGQIPHLIGPGGIVGDIANGYLGWKYGWKPLASDLYSLWNVSRGTLQDKALIITASRRVTSNWPNSNGTQYWPYRNQNIRSTNICKLCARVSDSLLRGAQKIGVTNPLSVAWEVIPYSFVVDWFMPIGSYLNALSATQGLDFVWGYESQWQDVSVEGKLALPSNTSGEPQGVSARTKIYSRTGFTSFPAPLPYVNQSPFSGSHMLSALALIKQLF